VNVIFGRKKQQASPTEPDPADLADELDDEELEDVADDETDDDDVDSEIDFDDEDEEVDDEADEWIAFDDSEAWREEGPFDIDEVDLESDETPRLDLGALIVTPEEGMQIQIIADAGTGDGLALVLTLESSAMQVEVKAAPQSGGFAAEVRGDIIEETLSAGGSAERTKGPYGTEMRRVVPVVSAEGEDSFAPLRDWLVEGPRWLLVARLMGDAAIDVSGEGASRPFDEAFRNLIVRRGDEPMAPGQTVPLKVPEG
jgi:Protein of unknown function (DUF3710)